MNWKNTPDSYWSAAITLHWLTFVLLVVSYATMELKSFAERGSTLRNAMASIHYLTGLIVFLLMWLRIALRAQSMPPAIAPPPPAWQESSSRLVHLLLYAMMIALPVLGWLTVSAAGKPVSLYVMDLPMLIGKDPEAARQWKWWHETIAKSGYFLIGLHIVAALFHHYIQGDNTLTRMLPRKFRRKAT